MVMEAILSGLMSMGTVGVFIGLALAGLFAWFYSGEKAKSAEKAEEARKKAWEDLQEWKREQDEVHTLPFEEGDDAP